MKLTILTKAKRKKIFDEVGTMQKLILQVEDAELFMRMTESLVNIAGELYSISELDRMRKELENG